MKKKNRQLTLRLRRKMEKSPLDTCLRMRTFAGLQETGCGGTSTMKSTTKELPQRKMGQEE